MKILLTRLSSLGDIVHNIPVLHDIHQHFPDAQIDWLVDRSCAPMLSYCAHLNRRIEVPLRAWRKSPKTLWRGDLTWLQWREKCNPKIEGHAKYDFSIDLQGLIKSAAIQWMLPTRQRVGMANRTEGSSFESLTRFFYDQKITLPFHIHTVTRARQLVAQVLGYSIDAIQDAPQCDFLPIPALSESDFLWDSWDASSAAPAAPAVQAASVAPRSSPPQLTRYAMLLHGTSRVLKEWPLEHWKNLGTELLAQAYQVVLPHSNARELQHAQILYQALSQYATTKLHQTVPAVIVLPRFSLDQMMRCLAHASLVVGVDSGLTHWASALGRPTVQLYCGDAIRWRTQWKWLATSAHLGEPTKIPTLDQVRAAVTGVLSKVAI